MIDIYLCDDDAAVRRQLQTILEQKILIEDYDMRIVCNAASPGQLLNGLGKSRRSIYFLDVELRDGQWDGFLLGREIRRRDPHGTLVYITSYGNLAYRTFQYHLEAFDYIVKEPEGLEESVGNCLEALHGRLIAEQRDPIEVYTVRTADTLRHIPLDEILFFETGLKPHHVLLHTTAGCIDFLGSLNEIEAGLKGRFLRTHRAYLVALDKIEEIDLKRGRLRAGGLECLVSRAAKTELNRLFCSV